MFKRESIVLIALLLSLSSRAARLTPMMLSADPFKVESTGFTAEWEDATPSSEVASYTLWVNSTESVDPDFVKLDEGLFDTYTDTGKNEASNYTTYLPSGWTCGRTLYVADKSIRFGYLMSPDYDMGDYDRISVVVVGKSYTTGTPHSAIAVTAITTGDSKEASFDTEFAEHIFVLRCGTTESLSIVSSNSYGYVSQIAVYAGDITGSRRVRKLAVVETGDAVKRLVEGIGGSSYTLGGLKENGTFYYRVKAIYTDGSESEWSNVEQVSLSSSSVYGDVNGDGQVTAADVKALYDIILGVSSDNQERADVNGDGQVTAADVKVVYDIILGV